MVVEKPMGYLGMTNFMTKNWFKPVTNCLTGLLWVHITLLWVHSMLLCMVCHAMMGMGNRPWDWMTMAGVATDDWVTCTGHGDSCSVLLV